MKKLIITCISVFLLFLFNNIKINAQEGTCIIQQLSNTYKVDLPFYWYKTTKTTTVNSMMQQNISYDYTKTYVNTSTICEKLNNSLPKKENDENNILNSTITTFYYSKNSLSDSEYIYKEGSAIFKYSPSSSDLKIKTTFLSLDNLPPVITNEGLNPTIITSLEEVINITYLQLKLTAYDEVDGIISIKVHEDNYTKNRNILGNHKITFSATDKSNNTSYFTITVKVEDTTMPYIQGNTNITSNMSNPITIKQIKDSLSVKDNYYQIENTAIKIHTDNYTRNEQIEGTFSVSFTVCDPSNNLSEPFVVHIKTYDDIAPTISGETSYEISYKTLLDLNELSKNLIINDNIDKNPSIELLKDDYSDKYFEIGLYQISFVAKDKNENTSSPYIININVKDLTKPTIYISQKFIGVDGNANIDIKDLIEIIETSNNINSNNLLSSTIIKDEYTPNKTIPGQYIIELNYEYENGDNINVETKIIVDTFNNETTATQEQKNTPNKTFWSVIKDFFLKIWNLLKNFFSFKWLKN